MKLEFSLVYSFHHFVILIQEIFTSTKRNLFDDIKPGEDKKKKTSSIGLRVSRYENISWAEKEIQKFERVHCLRNGLWLMPKSNSNEIQTCQTATRHASCNFVR